jgi:peptidoglycan/xylan/chitin deacetylase (PgdA/CDA1 family)
MLKPILLVFAMWVTPAAASALITPDLHLPPQPFSPLQAFSPLQTFSPIQTLSPRVALTFDACSGKIDNRILNALIDAHVKSTVFVTGRWLKRNAAAISIMAAHPDLFEIENHGAKHRVAISTPLQVFGVKSAGSRAGLAEEVEGGAEAVRLAFGRKPVWFRGATATYSKASEAEIIGLGYRIAGYNRLGDGGAMYSAARTAKAFSEAKDGDVIIAHINQPLKAAGLGVAKGIADLKARGFVFVTLNEVFGVSPMKQFGH